MRDLRRVVSGNSCQRLGGAPTVMASRRRALAAASAIAISAVTAPRLVHAQARGQQPGADTPRILIATCHTATPSPLGVDVAEALRSRVQSENSVRQLY